MLAQKNLVICAQKKILIMIIRKEEHFSKTINVFVFQEFARHLVYRYCDVFINAVVSGRIRRIPCGRHSKDGPCLCQFIQQRFFNLREEELA